MIRDRLLTALADFVVRRPAAVLVTALVLTAVAAALVPGLRVEAGHSSMVDPDSPHQKRYESFLHRFGSPNQLVVMVSGGDEAARRALVDRLEASLPGPPGSPAAPCPVAGEGAPAPNAPGCVASVLGKVDVESMAGRALLYVPEADLRALVEALESKRLGLRTLAGLDGLDGVIEAMTAEIEARAEEPAPTGDAKERAEEAMKVLARLFDELDARIQSDERAALPIEDVVFENVERRELDSAGYLTSADGSLKLAVIEPVDDTDDPGVVVAFVRYVDAVARAQLAEPGPACEDCEDGPLTYTLTGLPALIADETATIVDDITLTTIVAIVGILALFVFGFRSLRLAVIGLMPLLMGLLWSLAFVRLTYGHLNLITSAFIATVLGLGIDFAVHLLARFLEARRGGQGREEAARTAIGRAGPGILTGALTTSGAFFALMINDYQGFAQLGVITAAGLVFILGLTFTVTPAMLILPGLSFLQPRIPDAPASDSAPARSARSGGLAGLIVRAPIPVIAVGIAIAAFMLFRATDIPWSYDYLELLPEDLPSIDAMVRLSRETSYSADVAAIEADSVAQAREYAAELADKPTVRRVEAISSYIPDHQAEKLALLARLEPLLPAGPPPPAAKVDAESFGEALTDLSDAMEDARFEAQRGGSDEAALLDAPIASLHRLRDTLGKVAAAALAPRLASIQAVLLRERDRAIELLRQNVEGGLIDVATLREKMPPGLSDRLISKDGHFAVYAYPAAETLDEAALSALVHDLREVSPAATGFPITHWEAIRAIERGFKEAAVLALIVLIFLVFLDFRSVRYTLLSLLPLAMGVAWMWGGMSLIGMRYNAANVVAFPLILGIGIASGVHILHRYRQEGEAHVARVIRSTGLAVFLSAATTMVGFGSLALARHRGAESLGLLLLLGVGACLVTAIVFLPAVLQLLRGKTGPSDVLE